MNQKTNYQIWNPKRLIEKLFSVSDDQWKSEPSSGETLPSSAPPKPESSQLQSALSKLQSTELPEGERFLIDFSSAAKHFGEQWQGLKPRAQVMAIRLLVNHYGRELKYQLTDDGLIFVPQSVAGSAGVDVNSGEAIKLVQKILRQILGGEEPPEENQTQTAVAQLDAAAVANRPDSAESARDPIARLSSETIREGQRQFGLTEPAQAIEFAEGWEFSEGVEITPKIIGQSESVNSLGSVGFRPTLAPSVSAVRMVAGESAATETNFAEGWQGSLSREGERQWLGQTASPKNTSESLKLRLVTENNRQAASGSFQLISDGLQQVLNYKVGLRFGGLLDLNSDVVTTYIADPAEEVGAMVRSPFNALISMELSPPRAFALDCLTVDIVGRTFPVLRGEGAQFLLALPINAMTLQRMKLRTKYMERLKRLSEEERQLIRPMIYGLNEITPGRLSEILGLLRGIARAPLVRIAPESDNIEVLINEKSFGAMIDGTKYAAQLSGWSSDRSARLVRYAKNANLKLVLYNPSSLAQLQWAITQGFDFIQIATMDSTEEIPRTVCRIERKSLGFS